ncbi:hypothetical protein B0I35DRAFT_409027 [Stachybotrys elegans]|uniref:EthD domain-containing protein n=1 Tax=Stachybotrys elegans TaxID=80388 RepID=A0A8K0SPD2_9HYPO|nr:hypothetical protein B0I35DRAFT_409027 [Stachybotrys elegans]
MPHISIVLYPNNPGNTFDMKYYIDTHMPLVQENWGPFGLEKWQVIEYEGAEDAARTPYTVSAILTWKDAAAVKAALASPASQTVFNDVPKFSNQTPVFMSAPIIKET